MKTIKFLSLTVLIGALFAGVTSAAARMDKLKASTPKPVQPQAAKPNTPTMIAASTIAGGPTLAPSHRRRASSEWWTVSVLRPTATVPY